MRRGIAVALSWLLLLLTACSTSNAAAVDEQRVRELGEAFKTELDNTYIPIREDDSRLLKTDAVVVLDDRTYYIDRLYEFYEDYRMGDAASLTVVFRNKSFVIVKVIFEGSDGYLYRYELNPLNETEIIISSESLNKVEIAEYREPDKVELTLFPEKQTPKVFTFRNLRVET